jgi:hypothetical protein
LSLLSALSGLVCAAAGYIALCVLFETVTEKGRAGFCGIRRKICRGLRFTRYWSRLQSHFLPVFLAGNAAE